MTLILSLINAFNQYYLHGVPPRTLRSARRAFLCFVWISQKKKKMLTSLCSIKLLVFIAEIEEGLLRGTN